MPNCVCNSNITSNSNSRDPSRTLTLRAGAAATARRRFTRLKRSLVTSIVVNDAFGLRPGRVATLEAAEQDEFADMPLDETMAVFAAWLTAEEREYIFDDTDKAPTIAQASSFWLGGPLLAAYTKGMRRGRLELARAGYDVVPYDANTSFPYYYSLPAYRDRLSYVLQRSYTDLKNVTVAMDADIKRVLLEGLSQGLSPRDIALNIVASVDKIGIKRAMLIARTEVIAAHHAANIAEYRAAGVLGVKVLAEWLTAGDARVCPLCRDFAAKDMGFGPGIYTIDQIEFMIPAHPDCRCVAIPLDVTDSTLTVNG